MTIAADYIRRKHNRQRVIDETELAFSDCECQWCGRKLLARLQAFPAFAFCSAACKKHQFDDDFYRSGSRTQGKTAAAVASLHALAKAADIAGVAAQQFSDAMERFK